MPLNLLPFTFLFEFVIAPSFRFLRFYLLRIICAEDRDTIPPIGFGGRAEKHGLERVCCLELEQISVFFFFLVHIVSVYISIGASA